jgi:two-component system sensor kinase FixL
MATSPSPLGPVARYLRDAAVFAPCYIALDWASYLDPVGPFNITPWNPQPALAIVWMLLAGLGHAPAVMLAIMLADFVVRDAPAGATLTVLTAAVLTLGYALIALALRRFLSPDNSVRATRQLTLFVAAVVAGTAVVGAVFVGMLIAAGLVPPAAFADHALRFWVGDAVGMLVTVPLLLAVADVQQRAPLARLWRRPETLLQIAVLIGALWLVFRVLSEDPTRYFYLLFLPTIWIAVRGGLNGALVTVLTVQIGIVFSVNHPDAQHVSAIELQALLAALALTGFYLGIMVDERERANTGLRESLRLAAAGEMAGAIAHEVNQPLTALANYGEAARTLLTRGSVEGPAMLQLIEKMRAETGRAAEIVRRLRDFFREGTLRLQALEAAEVVAAGRRIAQQLIGARAVSLETHTDPGLPAVLADRVQVELILRNLISNALEALPAAGGSIRLQASLASAGPSVAGPPMAGRMRVCFSVADSGTGVAPESRDRLFQPFNSSKASGMGLGLAVSRAIAEAHGGSLELAATGHGEFHLNLPAAHAGGAQED